MKKTIQSVPDARARRLNQPPTTLLEMLEQAQATMPLSEEGKRQLDELRAASMSGRQITENFVVHSQESIIGAASI